jgi:hypothetical protein
MSEAAKRLKSLLDAGLTSVEEMQQVVISLQLKGDHAAAALIDAAAELNIILVG